MTTQQAVELYYDPFDHDIDDNPYPVWKRMRSEAPLYYNEKYSFYALSRWDDVARELPNWQAYRSGRGTTADILFSGIEVPPGILLFEDPPLHDLHRRLLSKVFTPRRMLAVEDLVRDFCVKALDPLRDAITMFAEYIEWRASHPSDDLMTDLLTAHIEEADGTSRPLTRTEVLAYTAMIAGAGNETTARLIGFMGQLLAEHPDQRRELAADPSLIPGAVEETLRFEPPSPVQARYVAQDVEHYRQAIPEGSYMLLLNGSANRDESKFTDPDRFDIHRTGGHLSFGQGLHFCLGSALARLEARVAFEEVLKRWTDWDVDYDNAFRAHTSSVRGWARLPVKF
ncbi:cytochrome P450 superfamily protein [Mycolicibacterium conceptionense]|uniref:Cytochrome P450 superfamily protein n=1 Tax=Mycolicibacterium conceptionense TaxID=451644 RepID=A0A0U1DII3_9MYCO|nr:cytochrome P450 superfamily protein [Mycolicibacterium conceptionense]